ncbi:hypothetical protein [Sinomonas terrae]|jgi:hypothetical protein|uniref:Uncharacterized protein n=1 Tax=Sinomonas terrae TaxID=2908838 RepID=A0ABS9U409_9MICC|nr:hypothetical protein [Sinomonas terrae]MCH6471424.1 hypothetical protein [Sinomonas terrae]
MASIENQDPVRSLSEDEDPSLDYSVEPDLPVWDDEDSVIDDENVVVEADPADIAEQHRKVED